MRIFALVLLFLGCDLPPGGDVASDDQSGPVDLGRSADLLPITGDVLIINQLPFKDDPMVTTWGLVGPKVMVLTNGSDTPPEYSSNQAVSFFPPLQFVTTILEKYRGKWTYAWSMEQKGSLRQGQDYVFTARHGASKSDYHHGEYSLAQQAEIESALWYDKQCLIGTKTLPEVVLKGDRALSAQYGFDDRTAVFRVTNETGDGLEAIFMVADEGAREVRHNTWIGTTLAGRGETPRFAAGMATVCKHRD